MMRQLFLLSLATLAACVAPPLANAHPAGDVAPPRVLVVEGSGEAAARADMATIRLGVRSFAPSAAAAMSETNRKAAATLKSLGKAGVADRDITTTGLSLNARYDYGQNRQEPRISGYEAANNVTVRLRDIDKVGATLDTALNAGANQMNGINFPLTHKDIPSEMTIITNLEQLNQTVDFTVNTIQSNHQGNCIIGCYVKPLGFDSHNIHHH